jgi:hypothetical protein
LTGLFVVVIVAGVAGVGPAATTPGSAQQAGTTTVAASQPVVPTLQEAPESDATVTRVRVFANGTAEWSVTIRFQLDTNESEQEFAAFQQEFETNRSQFLDRFRGRMTGVVNEAGTELDREMSAANFDTEIGIDNITRPQGFVTYRLHWRGFAAPDGNALVVGDAFQTGFFIQAGNTLIIESPDGYEPTEIAPEPDDSGTTVVQWDGPESFGTERPQVRVVPVNDTDGHSQTNDTAGNGTNVSSNDSSESSGVGMMPVFAGATGVVVLAGAGAFYVRRRRQPTATDHETAANGSGEGDDSLALGELATEEDKVIALLEAEGGRIRQSEIADRLDWSASKTSRVLSDMTDSGTVEKLRIGRENVIDLADEDGEP